MEITPHVLNKSQLYKIIFVYRFVNKIIYFMTTYSKLRPQQDKTSQTKITVGFLNGLSSLHPNIDELFAYLFASLLFRVTLRSVD